MRGLAEREHDIVRQLGEEQDIGDVRVECLVEQARCLAGRDEHDRRPSVLADRGELVRRQRRRTGRVEHDLQMAAGE